MKSWHWTILTSIGWHWTICFNHQQPYANKRDARAAPPIDEEKIVFSLHATPVIRFSAVCVFSQRKLCHWPASVPALPTWHQWLQDARRSGWSCSWSTASSFPGQRSTHPAYSAAFTLDRYAHVTASMQRESAARMQSFLDSLWQHLLKVFKPRCGIIVA